MNSKKKTSSIESRPEVYTGVRAYAALFVLLYHSWFGSAKKNVYFLLAGYKIDLTPWVTFGWVGVDIFFVLSGFLLTKQAILRLDRHGSKIGSQYFAGMPYQDFVARRAARVYPAYLACLTILILLAGNGVYGEFPSFHNVALHIFMAHNFVVEYFTAINGVFWTLPFEWVFYLVFPGLFAFMLKFGRRWLFFLAFAISGAAKISVITYHTNIAEFHLPLRIETFICGMCAASICASNKSLEKYNFAYFIAGLLCFLITPIIYSEYPHGGHYYDLLGLSRHYWVMFSIALVLIGLHGDKHLFFLLFENKIILFIGTISYSIYLFHVPLLEMLPALGFFHDRNHPNVSYLRVFVWTTATTIVVGAASYYLFEKPFVDAIQSSNKRKIYCLIIIFGWMVLILVATWIFIRTTKPLL